MSCVRNCWRSSFLQEQLSEATRTQTVYVQQEQWKKPSSTFTDWGKRKLLKFRTWKKFMSEIPRTVRITLASVSKIFLLGRKLNCFLWAVTWWQFFYFHSSQETKHDLWHQGLTDRDLFSIFLRTSSSSWIPFNLYFHILLFLSFLLVLCLLHLFSPGSFVILLFLQLSLTPFLLPYYSAKTQHDGWGEMASMQSLLRSIRSV